METNAYILKIKVKSKINDRYSTKIIGNGRSGMEDIKFDVGPIIVYMLLIGKELIR